MGNCVGDGSEGRVEGFRTYKRRKQAKSFSGSKICENGQTSVASQLAHQIVKEPWDGNNSRDQATLPWMDFHATVNSSDDCSKRNQKNVVLEHMYQKLPEDQDAVQDCIREALLFHQEVGCTMKELVDSDEYGEQCHSQIVLIGNGSQNAGVMSNRSLNESNQHPVTNRCQRALCKIIISEKFASLCKLMFESFQGSKAEIFPDLSLINSRLREGAYECSPVLFFFRYSTGCKGLVLN